MARRGLSDVVDNLLKISNGDVETFSRATADFARDVTLETPFSAYPAPLPEVSSGGGKGNAVTNDEGMTADGP